MGFASQKGEGKIGCIFWLIAALIFAMVLFKVVPVKIAVMQLEDHMIELAKTQPRKSQSFFVKSIVRRSEELRLDLTKKNVKVRKYKERVVMEVKFDVPVDLVITNYTWNVDIKVDRDLFLL